MKSFQDALEKLGNRESRKLANNTYLQKRPDGSIAVRLHATDVVTYKQDGAVVFNSGGWQTPTTKDRINNFSPVSIYQDKGIWYVQNGSGNWDKSIVYADGLTYKDGKFTGQGEDQTGLRKKVQKFAAEYIRKLAAGEIPAPGSGDCWGCLMKATDGTRPMGGRDHMLSHIEEKYYVPSMIVRAFETFGAAPVQQWGLAEIWGQLPKDETAKETMDKIQGGRGFRQWATDARSKRMLTRFIYRELGLAA